MYYLMSGSQQMHIFTIQLNWVKKFDISYFMISGTTECLSFKITVSNTKIMNEQLGVIPFLQNFHSQPF